jgi:methylenetetrahydrofolate--tRNA-(uracil-5-)-methyltransferase
LNAASLIVVGGGLAGAEAAWQAAERGAAVDLYEMRPGKETPAHKTDSLAELVCSNSLKSDDPATAAGLLKGELRLAESLIIRCADKARVPAGTALAVDRTNFGAAVTQALADHRRVRIIREEVTVLPEEPLAIIATGPLTSIDLAQSICLATGKNNLFFYDAVSPIVTADSLNREIIFEGLRHGEGEGIYLNCPMTKEEYLAFWEELVGAEAVELRPFERAAYFEACLPVEQLARRGRDSLAFGPLRPVGLVDPKTGRRPHAVVQLRPENREATMLNMVGFQTGLKWPEQERVFRMIPGLERAEFLRHGMIHRNTYMNSPAVLDRHCRLRGRENLFFAGQITGVEGYVESCASGLLAGINAARVLAGKEPALPPQTTMLGALQRYATASSPASFQPMNAMFGLLPELESHHRSKEERRNAHSQRALKAMADFLSSL